MTKTGMYQMLVSEKTKKAVYSAKRIDENYDVFIYRVVCEYLATQEKAQQLAQPAKTTGMKDIFG